MSERRHYSGPDLANLLRQVDDELGSDAVIVKADRVRSGGMAGFFAREHYEVVASRPDIDATTSPDRTRSGEIGAPDPNDEAISAKPISSSAPSPSQPERLATSPVAVPQPRRSIQAALLDRADQVSTEELLVRVAETHSAEWGGESFQSILGQAMVNEVKWPVDDPPVQEHQRDHRQNDLGPDRPNESINGLRVGSVRPEENIVDPVPADEMDPVAGEGHGPAVGLSDVSGGHPERRPHLPHGDGAAVTASPIERSAEQAGGQSAGQEAAPDPSTPPAAIDDGWSGQAYGPIPPPWANGALSPWGSPWMQGWSPWMVNGWSGHTPGHPTLEAAPRLCAGCANPVAPGGNDDNPSPQTLDGEVTIDPDVAASWSDLRREIDEVRLRINDLIGTIRHAASDGCCDCGAPRSVER